MMDEPVKYYEDYLSKKEGKGKVEKIYFCWNYAPKNI